MRLNSVVIAPLLAGLASVVSACEGTCIVDVTKAFLGNYTSPIHQAFAQLVSLHHI